MRLLPLFLIAVLLNLAPLSASASAEEAKAAYMRGAAKEKAKDYQGALGDYEAALAAYPGYFYANKQMGNCYYMLGRQDEALEQYEIYLAKKPDDAATRKFADSVRARAGSTKSTRASRASRAKEGSMGLNSSFYMGFALGMLNNDGSDIQKLYGPGSSVSVGVFAMMEDLRMGYQFSSGLAIEGGYENFNRFATTTYPGSSTTVLFTFSESVIFIEPMFRFQVARKITLDAGLKVGYASVSVQSASIGAYGGGSSAVFSGSGLMTLPEARVHFILGRRVGLDLGLGYRMDSISPLKSSSGYIQPDGSGSGNWVANNSGIEYKLGLNIYFSHLVN